MGVLVLGLDPGMSNVGYAVVRLGDLTTPLRMGLIQTKKSDKKLKVLASDDNFRRCKEISVALNTLIGEVEKVYGPVRVFCVEAKSFPRNASSAAKVAMFWGILAKLSVDTGIPVVQARPQEVKIKMCQKAKASKEEVRAACQEAFGKSDLEALCGSISETNLEHPYDALAVVVACSDSETVRLAMRMSV